MIVHLAVLPRIGAISDLLDHGVLVIFGPAIVEGGRQSIGIARTVFHRVRELLENIHAKHELDIDGEVEVFVTYIVYEATHPVGKPVTDDLALAAPFRHTRYSAHGRCLVRFVCSPDAQAPIAPERAKRLAHTQDSLATEYPVRPREDVFVVFTQRLDAIFVEVEIERRLPAKNVVSYRRTAQHQLYPPIGDRPNVVAHALEAG